MSRVLTLSVRNRFLLAFVVVAIVPLVVFGALVYARTSQTLREVERDEIVAQAKGTLALMNDKVAAERSFIRDYTQWDELHTAVVDRDMSWLRRNVTAWIPSHSSTDMVHIFDTRGRTVAHGGETTPDSTWENDEVQAARRGRIGADLEVVNGRLYALAAVPITSYSGTASAGVLVFGQRISDSVLRDMNRLTGGKGRLSVYTNTLVSAASDPAEASAFATFRPTQVAVGEVFGEDGYTSQLLAIKSKEGDTISLLKVSLPRETFSEALASINSIMILAYLLALIASVLVGWLVSYKISRPLRRLATAASGIAHGDYRQKLDLHRRDEIGRLAEAFDTMSARVAEKVEGLAQDSQTLALEISNLSAFGATLAQSHDPHGELRKLADMIRGMLDADSTSVFLVYEGHTTRATFSGGPRSPIPSPAADELACWVVDHGLSLQVEDAQTDAHLSNLARGTNTLCSFLVVPLRRQEGIVGALSVGYRDRHEFGREELPLLTTVGGQIAIALQNAEAYEKLDRMYLETVTALAAAMEAKDQYTASHADSLAAMAVAVGRQMGLSDAELRMLQYAAVLHDIGKIGIPGNILNKPDKLTREEFETMAQHTIIGERIISRIDYLVPIARIIRSAHERWDGKGYPDGCAGGEIPLAARILLVCDAFDAMTTDRPYRAALPVETALNELSANAGTQFDPRVVDVFLAAYPFRAGADDAERYLGRIGYADFIELN